MSVSPGPASPCATGGVSRALLALSCAFLLTVALAACGGGSSSTTSSTAATTATGPATTTAPKPAAHAPAAKNSHSQGPSHPSGYSRARAKAGAAAGFVVRQGDNSIPTYGSEASSSEQAAATASLGAYLNARAGGDWGGACAHMAAPVQKQLEALAGAPGAKAEGCAGVYAKLSARVPAAERANPLSAGLAAFRVEGDKAFALFYGPHNQKYLMPMVSEGGAWKVNQIAPVAYPLGAPTHAP